MIFTISTELWGKNWFGIAVSPDPYFLPGVVARQTNEYYEIAPSNSSLCLNLLIYPMLKEFPVTAFVSCCYDEMFTPMIYQRVR